MRRGIVTTPADDQELSRLVARVAEAPPIPIGDQLFQRLLRHRIVVLGQQVDDALANPAFAQAILPAARSPPAWPSTTSCSTCPTTSLPTRWAWPRRWGSSCSARAPRASGTP